MHLRSRGSKGVAINKLPIRKASELFGILNIVFFSPEDLNIIKNGPAERRRFLDSELCQLDKLFLSDLTKYNKILNQRNKLLKDIYFRPELADTLPVWDMQLVETGKRIIARRKVFIEELNDIIGEIHSNITGGKERILLKYEPNIDDIFFEDELLKVKQKDLRLAQTTVGPHRDDMLFSVNDIDIRKFGSQGQQRSAALSLKLAEIQIIKMITGNDPVLLLDDVLSELDTQRQKSLIDSIKNIQTIVTCTGLDEFIENHVKADMIYEVDNGTVKAYGNLLEV
jgi:DNA replication and repair protein RecF